MSASFVQVGGIVKKEKQEPRKFSPEVELLYGLSNAVRDMRSERLREIPASSRMEHGFCNRFARFCKKVLARFRLQ